MSERASETAYGTLADAAACRAAARALFVEGPWMLRTMQRWRPAICPFHRVVEAIPPGATVLDAGCGSGLLLGLAAWFGRLHAGVGFDASHAAIALAESMRLRLPDPSRLRFEQRDVSAPWPDGEFQAVMLIDLLHHVPAEGHERVLAAAAARVSAGGVLIYKDMAVRPRWRAGVSRVHDLVVARQRIHLRPFAQLRAMLERRGLVLQRFQSLPTGPYLHELGVFSR